MENKIYKGCLALACSIIIFAIITAFVVSSFNGKNGSVVVKGSAEKQVLADKVIWNISFVSAGNDLEQVNKKIIDDTEKVRKFLKKFRIDDKEISLGQLEFVDMDAREYRNADQKNRFIITQNIFVESNKVDDVEDASRNLLDLIQENVFLKESYGSMKPMFLFTELDKIKNDMIEEATKKAKSAAIQFAQNSGAKVGKIKKANQGVFVISGRNKTNQYENSELFQKKKEVRVVSTIEYHLK